MRKESVLRTTQADFEGLRKILQEDPTKESQVFTLCSFAEGPHAKLFLLQLSLLPGPGDLEKQSSAGVAPTAEFQALAYGLAYDLELSVFDFHTHPWTDEPQLSGIDYYHGTENARFIARHFPEQSTMGMVVFGRSLRNFDGRIWDRSTERFENIDRVEVLGSPLEILGADSQEVGGEDDPYARHLLIPGWKQGILGALKVFLVGLGGNGSVILPSLLALGVGRTGWVKACDPDALEATNLSRILYACPEDVGKSKAEVAQRYAERKAPDIAVTCYQASIQAESMMAMAKEAHLLIGTVDNAGARKVLNSLSARYLIPYLDLGVEIIPNEGGYEAVGQVRAVIPGRSGCLFCTGDIDPSEAALDLLTEEERRERAQRGYVRGTDLTPAPSVLHLNGVVSHLAVSQFLRLVFGEKLEGKEFLHYDRQSCQLIAAKVEPNPECPVCGEQGYLGAGDEPQPRGGAPGETPKTRRLSKGAWVDQEESPDQSQDGEGEALPEPEPDKEKGEEPNGC